jgi:hypothetical protein
VVRTCVVVRSRKFPSAAALCATAVSLLLASAASASEATALRPCALPSLRNVSGLPAAIVATTSCGRFELGIGGAVRFVGPKTLPVPAGVNWYQDLSWYRIARGHLIVGRGHRTYWRTHARYPTSRGSGVGAVAVSHGRVAFSFAAPPANWKPPTLYVARSGGIERVVARGETPIGWTARGSLVTWGHAGSLRVRDGDGRLMRTLAVDVYTFVFDPTSHALLFLANGQLERFDGRRLRSLVRLSAVGLSRPLTIQPVGAFVALRGRRRLVVIRRDGEVISTTALPHLKLRTDRVSSEIAADTRGNAAFTATRDNTAYGSTGTETIYLLRHGASSAQALYRKRVAFAVCERQAALAWRGRWLLYSASEGYAAAVHASTRRAVDFSSTISRLPGTDAQNFTASWMD